MACDQYLAVDLGAESGRVMCGVISEGRIVLSELHRFPNIAVRVPHKKGETFHWDTFRLWHEIQTGIGKGVAEGKPAAGIGIDTWGVDYGLLNEDGVLIGNPVCYRDPRTEGCQAKVDARIPRAKLYAVTGIQSMFFNTIYQLACLSFAGDPIFQRARHLLFMPDLIAYWLTGRMANEYTIASTTALLDAKRRNWSDELLAALEIPRSLFPEIIYPASAHSAWGKVQPGVGQNIGAGAAGVPVLAVGSHDTASAVAAVPAEGDDWLYISSGTWSLMGAEIPQPILSARAGELNLTNEGGIGNTIRLLKNVAGMYFVQECRRAWAKAGREYDYAALAKMAEAARPHTALIDPDDPAFHTPGEMPMKIAAYLKKTGQPVPADDGQMIRVVLESLAAAYARVKNMIEEVTGRKFKKLHIVGGGCQNHLLNQLAADATGLTVMAGPVEATALGNIMSQAISTGTLGSIAQGRTLIARSAELKAFTPRETEKWEKWMKGRN